MREKHLIYVSNFKGFKYVKHSDDRKFVMEHGNIAAATIKFLRTIWMRGGQGHEGLKVPVRKGSRLVKPDPLLLGSWPRANWYSIPNLRAQLIII
jgi:hypothetical protein